MTRQDEHPGGRGGHAWVSGTRGWVLIAASALAFFCLVAGVTYLATSKGASARLRPLAAASPDPDSTEPVPPYNVPVQVEPVALPSTGAIPLPGYEQPQARTWQAGPGGTALERVSSQAGSVVQAEGLKQYVELKAACTQLAASVTSAQEAPPIPDTAMQALYQKALRELAAGAGKCQLAIFEQPDGDEYVATTENRGQLRAAAVALSSGSRDLFLATSQIATLGQG